MAVDWPHAALHDNYSTLPAVEHSSAFTQTDLARDAAFRLPRLSFDDYTRPRPASVYQSFGGPYGDHQRSLSCHSHDWPAGRQNEDKFYSDPSAPLLRCGRLGGQWRHIRQVTGNLGNHICFVDGTVKLKDMMLYPPFGYRNAPVVATRVPQTARLPSARRTYIADNIYRNKYSENARSGKTYWYDDKLPTLLLNKPSVHA